MALGAGKPVVPVQTQMALAEQCRTATGADRILVALDARMNEIYFAAYEWSADSWREAVPPMLVKPDALPAIEGDGWFGIGSGFDVSGLAASLSGHYGANIENLTHGALPSARDVAAIAARQLAKLGIESALSPEHAAPLYLRNNVAMTIVEREALRLKKAAA